MPRFVVLAVSLGSAAALWVGGATASAIVDRDVVDPVLKVDAAGRAGISYRSRAGAVRHVLVWDAVNAYSPSVGGRQVRFRKDYAGGWGVFRRNVVATMKNTCSPVQLALPWLVSACKARDGSFWALQSWQRPLPNLGLDPWRPEQKVWELHVSHWTGDVAQLEVHTDWVYSSRVHHLFGRLTYGGKPVFGFSTTPSGAPLDGWGRNIYLDTLNSAYGPGWRRENSFLAHKGTGVFCYGFYAHPPYPGYPAGERPPGQGQRYRITVIGPGVTPVVGWEGDGLPDYDPGDPGAVDHEVAMNTLVRSWNDPLCRHR